MKAMQKPAEQIRQAHHHSMLNDTKHHKLGDGARMLLVAGSQESVALAYQLQASEGMRGMRLKWPRLIVTGKQCQCKENATCVPLPVNGTSHSLTLHAFLQWFLRLTQASARL